MRAAWSGHHGGHHDIRLERQVLIQALSQLARAAVAVACRIFELLGIQNAHLAAPAAYYAGGLELACHEGHGSPLHADHMREKPLGQRQDITIASITQLKQPAAYARLRRV